MGRERKAWLPGREDVLQLLLGGVKFQCLNLHFLSPLPAPTPAIVLIPDLHISQDPVIYDKAHNVLWGKKEENLFQRFITILLIEITTDPKYS